MTYTYLLLLTCHRILICLVYRKERKFHELRFEWRKWRRAILSASLNTILDSSEQVNMWKLRCLFHTVSPYNFSETKRIWNFPKFRINETHMISIRDFNLSVSNSLNAAFLYLLHTNLPLLFKGVPELFFNFIYNISDFFLQISIMFNVCLLFGARSL